MIKLIKESNNGVMIKTETSGGTFYLIKSATRNKKFWNTAKSYVNEFAKKETALNKLYTVILKLPEYAFYDEDDMFDFEDEKDLKKAKFAKFYVTDMNGNVIEDISAEVKNHLLADNKFIDAVLHDEDDFDESCKITEDYFDSEDDYRDSEGYITEDHADYLECGITLTMYSFTESIGMIREYIIEEVTRSRDCNKISADNYKYYERRRELVDIDGDPYNLDGQNVVDLVVRFIVDENGEYDFNEYIMDESIREVRMYLRDTDYM